MRRLGRGRATPGRARIDPDNQFRKLREKSRVTAESACKELGVALSTLKRYENGLRTPSPKVALKMAALYNCTLEDIYRTKQDAG